MHSPVVGRVREVGAAMEAMVTSCHSRWPRSSSESHYEACSCSSTDGHIPSFSALTPAATWARLHVLPLPRSPAWSMATLRAIQGVCGVGQVFLGKVGNPEAPWPGIFTHALRRRRPRRSKSASKPQGRTPDRWAIQTRRTTENSGLETQAHSDSAHPAWCDDTVQRHLPQQAVARQCS